MLRLRVLGLCLLAALSASAQAPPTPPANPLLVNHTNWFLPAEVWDIQSDPRLSAHVPKNLDYKATARSEITSPTRSPSSVRKA